MVQYYMYSTYGMAQFELDNCTQVAQEILGDTCE